jgi:ATP-binding cassette subfamily F protein 3
MMSKEILKTALNNFEGTVLIISHDRDFLEGLVEKIFEFTKDGIKEHIGSINDFLAKKAAEDIRSWETEKEKNAVQRAKNNEPKAKPDNNTGKPQEDKKLKNELSKIEQLIESLEKEIAASEKQLQDPEKFQQLQNDASYFAKYNALKQDLEKAMLKWEELSVMVGG